MIHSIPYIENLIEKAAALFNKRTKTDILRARQLLFSLTPTSKLVELFLYDNDYRPQKLDGFPMMVPIYDDPPRRLLLKCSRKTLKSTLLSNIMCLKSLGINSYKMMYVGPQEATAKYFSRTYLNARFDSPALKHVFEGFSVDDVFEKRVKGTNSQILLKYASEDATRIRGPATDHNVHDEVQNMSFDILPVISETMALSDFKNEIYAGTPLTTENTINALWLDSSQMEWMMKCTHCNHWNSLTEDNDPMAMIGKEGFRCSKCSKPLNSRIGQWISFKPENKDQLVGYHLAQPILPFYNESILQWNDVYDGVFNKNYSEAQVYQEKFGIAFDTAEKPITEAELRKLCILGEMSSKEGLKIVGSNKHKYVRLPGGTQYVAAVDFGVNGITSRTALGIFGIRADSVIECVYGKAFENNTQYKQQLVEMAAVINSLQCLLVCDSGPDPARGIELINMCGGGTKGQLIRYEAGKYVQRYESPPGAYDWTGNRWVLHRSDCMSFTFKQLKDGGILFPRWEDIGYCVADATNIFVEVKDLALRQEMYYRRIPKGHDDFFHVITWACLALHTATGNPNILKASSFAHNAADDN